MSNFFDKLRAGVKKRSLLDAVSSDSSKNYEYYNVLSPKSPYNVAESYRRLYANLTYLPMEGKCRKIAITSALGGEGKTTVAVNLAITLAQNLNSAKVLLINTDLRKPGVELMLSQDFLRRGLSEYLSGADAEPNILTTSVGGLYVLFSGDVSENPTRLISSERMEELFRFCEKNFDYIILDTPALDVGSEALLMKKHINGYVLVTKAMKSDVDSVDKAIESLRVVEAPILGMVLTGAEVKRQRKKRFSLRRK